MNLSPLVQTFVLHFGEMGGRWGVNRTVGQIYALLFLSDRPLNAEEIIAQKDYLRLKAERERAAVALRAAEDRLRLLGVDPKRLSRVESTFPLTAPLAGTVVQKISSKCRLKCARRASSSRSTAHRSIGQ